MLFNNTNMRTAMAYTNAVGDKVYPIIVDIKKGIKSTEEVSFVSSDINTGILSVAFIQGNDTYNVEGAEVICSIMRPDTTTLEIPCDIIRNNTVEVPLGVNGTSQDGVYSFDFKVFKGGNKIVGTPIMNYSVSLSIGNDNVVLEDDRLPVLTMLMTQVSELHDRTDEAVVKANTATEATKVATANAIEATNNANAVSERVSQETATTISEIKQDTANAIADVNATSDTMVENVNNAISSMDTTINNKISEMADTVNNKISEVNTAKNDMINDISSTKANMVTEVTNAKNEMTATVTNKVNEVEGRFNALTASQQQSSEVIDARDGETSLKARLDRDIEKAKQVYVNVEGSHISTDSSSGYLKDVEILGNTVQDASNLADIRSVGDKVEGQELYEIPIVSCGKNLFKGKLERGWWNVTLQGQKQLSSTDARYCCDDFIEIDNSKSYMLSSAKYDIWQFWTLYYDENKNYLNVYNHLETIPNNAKYITFYCVGVNAGQNLDDLVQLEEGAVATPYEPYVEDKLTILSPVQLEKVGDVADRIIEKDGVWGVEKNVETVVLNGSESWKHFSNSWGTLFDAYVLSDKIAGTTNLMTDTIPVFQFSSDETSFCCMSSGNSSDRTRFFIKNPPNIQMGDVTGFKTWLSENNVLVKYPLTTPQFIPLPHDQQVKLRTFANKTNISFGCEIEGTIKAQVPKSLGATVNTHTEQISNLNKELDRVKKLEESTVSTVETESDFTTVEATSNGYFEDVKLEGKTLVNLLKQQSSWTLGANTTCHCFYELLKPLEVGKTYTYFYFNLPNTITQSYLGTASGDIILVYWGAIKKAHSFIATEERATLTSVVPHFKTNGTDTLTTSEIENIKVVLLEGDHTQNPPSFFEGLASVGDGADEIVVSSVKGDGNLFDKNAKDVVIGKGLNLSTGEATDANNDTYACTGFIRVVPMCQYYKSGNEAGGVTWFYDKNKKPISYISVINGVFNVPSNAYYIRTNTRISSLDTLQIKKGIVEVKYIPHQSDKKRLLYYNNETQTWEKPTLRQWDSIEKHADGKYYYHQRSGEVVLNGNEGEKWAHNGSLSTSDYVFMHLQGQQIKPTNSMKDFICDKLTIEDYNIASGECISKYTDGTQLVIKVATSKLSTQNVQGFKQWLQANNVTVVYQLAQEKVYECTNIDLITYANETNYIVECGAIVPRSTLKVHNNISNVVRTLQEKVSLLEDKFIQGLKQVLAGDMYSLAELLYPEDFVEENPENNIMLLPFE